MAATATSASTMGKKGPKKCIIYNEQRYKLVVFCKSQSTQTDPLPNPIIVAATEETENEHGTRQIEVAELKEQIRNSNDFL